jgi:hypothetical protein
MHATRWAFIAGLVLLGIADPMVGFAQISCTTTVSCAQAAVTAAAKAQASVDVLTAKLTAAEKRISALENAKITAVVFPTNGGFFEPTAVYDIASTSDFKMCALSAVQINSATCEVQKTPDKWRIQVIGPAGRCKVACFKIE